MTDRERQGEREHFSSGVQHVGNKKEKNNTEFEFPGTGVEFTLASEQILYSTGKKGLQYPDNPPTIASDKKSQWIHQIDNLTRQQFHGLRIPEVLALFEKSQFEHWNYVSWDRKKIDGVIVSVEFMQDHVLQPPNPPLWQLERMRLAEGYCIRFGVPNAVVSLCLHPCFIQSGPTQVTRRVEFRAMSRDPEKYTIDESNRYHARKWKNQEIGAAVAFDLGVTVGGKTPVTGLYHPTVEPFYKFLIEDLTKKYELKPLVKTKDSEGVSETHNSETLKLSLVEKGRLKICREAIIAKLNGTAFITFCENRADDPTPETLRRWIRDLKKKGAEGLEWRNQ